MTRMAKLSYTYNEINKKMNKCSKVWYNIDEYLQKGKSYDKKEKCTRAFGKN